MFKKFSDFIKWLGDHFKGMLFLLILLIVFMPTSESKLKPANLQEIKLTGPIMDADKVLKEIDKARKDDDIKGVLFNVNSPGGAVPPSIEICHAIKELKEKKPVIAYASGIMASGSYYASIYANKIIANPGSIVGSIGVIMEAPNLHELMEKVGVGTQIVKQGEYKEAGTPTREWTPKEREELERLTKDTYELFVSDVAKARGLDVNNSTAYADAHIFSSKRAKKAGLIDEIATKRSAKEQIAALAKVKEPVWKEKDKLESFFEDLSTKSILKLQSYFYGLKAIL
ncbi:signal peptide peptidase SppA [Sulfurovum sp. NBC37-1]|uniref:signal peptide peptidase SppA n=1 Tax=Sulfurovum sp. (strain NBC37-1) TaxID=387093 RepID=UPI0001587872|nr:signal peptide peptidase SppA [Sulfurovum sp. NBC37-1]BAF71993.1 protease IV [Sulfurovum sp. NBC37-1]